MVKLIGIMVLTVFLIETTMISQDPHLGQILVFFMLGFFVANSPTTSSVNPDRPVSRLIDRDSAYLPGRSA